MPVPIRPIQNSIPGGENNNFLDYSFLAQQVTHNEKKKVTASNSDAEALMKIWLEADTKGGKYSISSDFGLSRREITRLKSYGLVAGSDDDLVITDRGRKVITVMALGEGNKFEKGKSEKNYLEILASMDKRGKDGYRIPKFCSNTSNNLDVTDVPKK
jgi:hypothetical protein